MTNNLWRYASNYVFIIFIVWSGAIEASAIEASASDRWNLLLITADDLNGDAAQWSGSKHLVTPNLDAFATTAHRFANHHVTISICQPGRAVLMTGRLPHRNGALGFQPIRQDIPTLVEILRQEGYFAGVIAKAAHMMPSSKFPWDSIGEQSLGKQPIGFSECFRAMVAQAKERNQPFFINANICDPHRPFITGNAKGKQDGNEALEGVRTFQPEEVSVPSFLEDLPPVRKEIAHYTASVSRFDRSLAFSSKSSSHPDMTATPSSFFFLITECPSLFPKRPFTSMELGLPS